MSLERYGEFIANALAHVATCISNVRVVVSLVFTVLALFFLVLNYVATGVIMLMPILFVMLWEPINDHDLTRYFMESAHKAKLLYNINDEFHNNFCETIIRYVKYVK